MVCCDVWSECVLPLIGILLEFLLNFFDRLLNFSGFLKAILFYFFIDFFIIR
jgi:hypothetical protein